LYGLLTATISYALFLLGFDFYIYTTREILKFERNKWGALLKNQAVLSITIYAIFLPLLFLIFVSELLPWKIAIWFFVLLVLEHINQELSRILIAVSEQLTASIAIFLRFGVWAFIVTAWMLAQPDSRNLQFVLGGWTIGGALALCLSVYRVFTLRLAG